MLVTIVTSTTGYSVFLYWHMNSQQQKAVELSEIIGLVLGQSVAKLILLNDVSVASDITTKLKPFKNLQRVVLYKKDKTPIFQYAHDDRSFAVEPLQQSSDQQITILSKQQESLKLQLSAQYQGTDLGYLILEFKIKTLYETILESLSVIVFVLIFMLITSYILAHIFATKFTDPILKLVGFLEKIDLLSSLSNKRAQTEEVNEFGKLYAEINKMLDRLEDSHQALKIASVAFETQSGMTITDKDQKILQVNEAFTKITGYSKSEVIGQNPSILKSGLHTKEFYEKMYKSLKENHIWIGEVKNKNKKGNIVNEHLIIQSVLDDKGEIIYYVASFLDITEQKLIEAKLTEKERILIQQSKMAQMGEMLENIAHQWRQPLSVITTSATGAKTQHEYGILDDKILEDSLDNIAIAATHLSQTVDDFRNFYKDDKIVKKFLLEDVVEKSLDLLISKFKNKDIEIIKDFDVVSFEGYENELIQVFINLLNNARDELLKLDGKRLIFITITKEQDSIKISFQDNGGGVPKEILPNIFESHFTTKADDGTGIGLYMSRMIVENMNGSIEASNQDFEYEGNSYFGANFTISFLNH